MIDACFHHLMILLILPPVLLGGLVPGTLLFMEMGESIKQQALHDHFWWLAATHAVMY
jgi:hypothetical protein